MLLSDLRAQLRRDSRRLDRLSAAAQDPHPRPPAVRVGVGTGVPAALLPRPPADFHAELFERLRELHRAPRLEGGGRSPRARVPSPPSSPSPTSSTARWSGTSRSRSILSDSAGQAQDQLRHVRHELETNDAIARDYPDAAGMVRCGVRTGSSCGTARWSRRWDGRAHPRAAVSRRPGRLWWCSTTWRTTTPSPAPSKRERAWRWATREVIPAGTAGTNFLSVGCGTAPGGRRGAAGSIARLDRAHLPGGEAVARADGPVGRVGAARDQPRRPRPRRHGRAVLLGEPRGDGQGRGSRTGRIAGRWWRSIRRRAEIGSAAFDTEYQGVPSVEGLSEFPAEYFDRPELWFDDWPEDLVYRVQSLDPSKGADAKSGDFQAHVLVGLDSRRDDVRRGGADPRAGPADGRSRARSGRRGSDRSRRWWWRTTTRWGCWSTRLTTRSARAVVVVPLQSVFNTQPKVVRGPGTWDCTSDARQVRFRNTRGTHLLVDQLRDFPNADFDDGPDALDLAVRALEPLTNPRDQVGRGSDNSDRELPHRHAHGSGHSLRTQGWVSASRTRTRPDAQRIRS